MVKFLEFYRYVLNVYLIFKQQKVFIIHNHYNIVIMDYVRCFYIFYLMTQYSNIIMYLSLLYNENVDYKLLIVGIV